MNESGPNTSHSQLQPQPGWAGGLPHPGLRRGQFRFLSEQLQPIWTLSLAVGEWADVGKGQLKDASFADVHFQVFYGKANSHLIARQPISTLGKQLAEDDSVGFDQGVQSVRNKFGRAIFIVEGSDELLVTLDEERSIDLTYNSCTECLTHGKCVRCGGTGRVVTVAYNEAGKGRYEETYCRFCAGDGKCMYCYEVREVILAVAQLMEDGQFVRADAMLDATLAKLSTPRSGGLGDVLLRLGATVVMGYSRTAHEQSRQVQRADLLFQKATIRLQRRQISEAVPFLQQALQHYPNQVGAVSVLKELGL